MKNFILQMQLLNLVSYFLLSGLSFRQSLWLGLFGVASGSVSDVSTMNFILFLLDEIGGSL